MVGPNGAQKLAAPEVRWKYLQGKQKNNKKQQKNKRTNKNNEGNTKLKKKHKQKTPKAVAKDGIRFRQKVNS